MRSPSRNRASLSPLSCFRALLRPVPICDLPYSLTIHRHQAELSGPDPALEAHSHNIVLRRNLGVLANSHPTSFFQIVISIPKQPLCNPRQQKAATITKQANLGFTFRKPKSMSVALCRLRPNPRLRTLEVARESAKHLSDSMIDLYSDETSK